MNDFEAAWQMSLRLLARRSYSEQEIRGKLAIKGYSQQIIQLVTAGLLDYGYINDLALCRAIFDQYCRYEKYGLRKIIGKLKQRGLSNEIISKITRSYDSAEEWREALCVVKNRFKVINHIDKRRIGQFLTRRGYSYDAINKVFEEIF